MLFVDAAQVHQLLDYPSLVKYLHQSHKKTVDRASSVLLDRPSKSGAKSYFLAASAWHENKAIGTKLVTVFPDNIQCGSALPSVQAIYILFDGITGKPTALIDGTALTLRKTAAVSALGMHLIAKPKPKKLLMIGAGALAPHLIAAHCSVRDTICEIKIWNRTPERALRMINKVSVKKNVSIQITEDLQGSIQKADVISCATMATEPLVKGKFIKSGTHLDLVGSYRPDMMECDEHTMLHGSIFTDSPWSAVEDCGEIIVALNNGTIDQSDILANLFDLAQGKHFGRKSTEEITIFKNGGGGHLDLMVAQHLVSKITKFS